MRKASCFRLLLAALSLAFAAAAQAQSNEDRLRDQLRQTTLQLRALQDENSALKAREQALQQQLGSGAPRPAAGASAPTAASAEDSAKLERRIRDGLREEIEKQVARQAAKAAAEDAALRAGLEAQLAASQAELTRYRQGFENAAQAARARDADAKQLQAQLEAAEARGQAGDAALQDCSRKNLELVDLGRELLGRYRDKGVWESMRDSESVIGIARVRLETVAQSLQGRIRDNTVGAAPVSAASAP